MNYEFKIGAEAGWLVAVAVLTVVLQALVEFDPATISDWRAWAIGIGAAMVRAFGGAGLAVIASGVSTERES